jgi:transketolase N-terminal domain/subunit
MIVVSDNPPMSLEEMNRRLHVIGWDSFEMDDNTLQLIIASLEAEGLTGAEDKPVELFKEKYEKNSRDF